MMLVFFATAIAGTAASLWLGLATGKLFILALLLFMAGHYLSGKGEVGATAIYLASYKSSLPLVKAFFMGILCNVLVSLAAYLALAGRSLTDKVLAIIFPISAFIAAGFEHCVAEWRLHQRAAVFPALLMKRQRADADLRQFFADILCQIAGNALLPDICGAGHLALGDRTGFKQLLAGGRFVECRNSIQFFF